jgi:AcrR family transcriptional regulator
MAADDGESGESTVPEKRRAQIVETAVRLFAENGYHRTTIDGISSAR